MRIPLVSCQSVQYTPSTKSAEVVVCYDRGDGVEREVGLKAHCSGKLDAQFLAEVGRTVTACAVATAILKECRYVLDGTASEEERERVRHLYDAWCEQFLGADRRTLEDFELHKLLGGP